MGRKDVIALMNDIITTACKFVTSSIGRKILVALTGSCLLLFLVGHLAGNMTIFGGDVAAGDRSWIEYYATGLHSMPAWLLWSIRLGLLAVGLVHIVLALVLKYENYNARTHYQKEGTLKATLSSRTMVVTGIMISGPSSLYYPGARNFFKPVGGGGTESQRTQEKDVGHILFHSWSL